MAGQLAAYGYEITGNEIYNVFYWFNVSELSFLKICILASTVKAYFNIMILRQNKMIAIIHCLDNYRYHILKILQKYFEMNLDLRKSSKITVCICALPSFP